VVVERAVGQANQQRAGLLNKPLAGPKQARVFSNLQRVAQKPVPAGVFRSRSGC